MQYLNSFLISKRMWSNLLCSKYQAQMSLIKILLNFLQEYSDQSSRQMDKRNDSIERVEKQKLKKSLVKEMQLFRLREPNMTKKEYQTKLAKLMEDEELIEDIDVSSPSKNTPRAILRQLLLVTSTIKDIPLTNNSEQSKQESTQGIPSPLSRQSVLQNSRTLKARVLTRLNQQDLIRKTEVLQQPKIEEKGMYHLTELEMSQSVLNDSSVGQLPPLQSHRPTHRVQKSSPLSLMYIGNGPTGIVPLSNSSIAQMLSREEHQEFVRKMKELKRHQYQKKMEQIERDHQRRVEMMQKQSEFELQLKEEREASLEIWRKQIQERIEEQRQRRLEQMEPLKSLYSKNASLIVTDQIRKKQPPLYVQLNQQFEKQREVEERMIQERLRQIRDDKKPIRIEEIRKHEASVERETEMRKEERKNKRMDAYLSHIQSIKHRDMETDLTKRIKDQIQMERAQTNNNKQEILKLYHKKVNYGHKIMELYKPDSFKIMKQKDKVAEMKEQLMRELSSKKNDYLESRQLHGIYHPAKSSQSPVKYSLRKPIIENNSVLACDQDYRNHLSKEALANLNSDMPLIEQRNQQIKPLMRNYASLQTVNHRREDSNTSFRNKSSSRNQFETANTPKRINKTKQMGFEEWKKMVDLRDSKMIRVSKDSMSPEPPGNRQFEEEQIEDFKRMKSLKQKIQLLSQSDAL
ncbi:hypothetical protein FGO68_gene6192 [Halteria grandinella]|uniref:Uncharacterized protein n=1 Tax=Halteria grandinella TaxID=5974 RepID=A0A8J8T7F5_HALGN|nr:hypothetical protein FGO68_gene6192 [Halteria grandinella]